MPHPEVSFLPVFKLLTSVQTDPFQDSVNGDLFAPAGSYPPNHKAEVFEAPADPAPPLPELNVPGDVVQLVPS